MNFSEAMFYENYLTWDFHTNTVFQACLPTRQNGVENRDKAYSKKNVTTFLQFIQIHGHKVKT